MQISSPMITLCSLAQKALDQATLNLGQVRRSYTQAQQQLSTLLDYQLEYRQRLDVTMSDGIAANTWRNYQQFITTLEEAITHHQKQLVQWEQRVNEAVNQWQDKQQRLNAYQTLQQRACDREKLQENRRDQKQTDEFAQRSTLRNK